jgi:4'-phosphopantetheinyl transferase
MKAGRQVEVRLAELSPLIAAAEIDGSTWLSHEERSRLDAMRSETRRRQYLAGHWLIRCLAAEMFGGAPSQWLLTASAEGVPVLQSAAHNAGQTIPASLSHSAGWVAAAIAPFPVGIDLECESKPRDLLALADEAFSPAECAQLRRLPANELAPAFYLFWTLKEATGKREGHGLRTDTARRQQPICVEAADADVVSWQFANCSMAVAGEVGMSVRVLGLPVEAQQRYWRIAPAAA